MSWRPRSTACSSTWSGVDRPALRVLRDPVVDHAVGLDDVEPAVVVEGDRPVPGGALPGTRCLATRCARLQRAPGDVPFPPRRGTRRLHTTPHAPCRDGWRAHRGA